MTIEFECGDDDIRELNRFFVQTPAGKKEMLRNYVRHAIAIFFVAMGALGVLSVATGGYFPIAFLFMSLIGAAVSFLLNLALRKRNQDNYTKALIKRGNYASILGKHTMTLTPEGIEGTHAKGRYCTYWSGISTVHETKNHIYLQISPVHFVLVPKRAFASPTHGAEFLRAIEQYRQQATGEPIPQTTKGAWWTQGQSMVEDPQSNRLGRN
ncbi:MAG: YcxB family protein [Armatimonas sp.]